MMKKYITSILIVLFLKSGFAQVQAEEILFVPWNDNATGNVGFSLDPEGRVGPQNFQIQNDSVYLLDQQNNAINLYSAGNLADRLPVLSTCRDFIIQNNNEYACLADNDIVMYKNRELVEIFRQQKPLPIIRKLTGSASNVIAINHDGTTSKILNGRLSKTSALGEKSYQLKKASRSRVVIDVIDENGDTIKQISLDIPGNDLGSFQMVGADQHSRLFLDINFIIQEVPLKVGREVWIITQNGETTGKINIPTHYYTMTWNDLRLDDRGILYQMLTSEDGVHILKFDFSEVDIRNIQAVYPEKFQRYLHYNDTLRQPESLEKKSPISKPEATVTRAEALAIGDTYAVHEWSCTSANLTGTSGVTAPDGLLIITPSWIKVGENIRIPYKWGGFSTLAQFDDGLESGKYAGDKYTSKSSGSSYAVGVDCSGFVSRCWKLSSHYSTSMMPNITTAYLSWEDLKPGDAIHKVGHVRLAVENNSDGTILAVEAAGSSTDWRVNYRTYTYIGLSDYTPRYYNNMTGSSIPIAQPILLSTINSTDTQIKWSLGSTENVSGIEIEHSNDGTDWESLLGETLISPDTNEYSCDWDIGPHFIRLKSVNNSNGTDESLPSDYYGFYTPYDCVGKVLIVDGFDRSSGSWGLPYHPFAQWMGVALSELRVPFDITANDAVISGDIILTDYHAVYWILGDEGTADETFSSVEQMLVADYLKNGGNLFVSGSEVGYDLDNQGGAADKSFFLNYLHADYIQDDANDYTVSGAASGIFSGISFEYDDGSAGIYQEDYPDIISPMLNAIVCLEYSSGVVAGIQYEGTFGDGTTSGKLVYFAFPWETITNSINRKEILRNISEWFGFTCHNIDPDDPLVPDNASLSHGYPNPFNNTVMFDLIMQNDAVFDIYVYNSRGQIVRTIDRPEYGHLEYQIGWDGRNNSGETVASGCYFFQVVFKNQVLTEKIIFLK